MQDNKNLHAFDNDILQCKADILRALGGSIEPSVPTPPQQEQPVSDNTEPIQDQLTPDDTDLDVVFLEEELQVSDVKEIHTALASPISNSHESHPAENIIIPSFEDLPKRSVLSPIDREEPQIIDSIENSPIEIVDELLESSDSDMILSEKEELIDITEIESGEEANTKTPLPADNEPLRRELAREQNEKQSALDQLKSVNEAIEPLRTANERMEQRINELTAQNQAAADKNNELHQGLLKTLEQEKEAHESTMRLLQSRQNELQKIQKARDFLSESFSSITEQNHQLQMQIEQLKQEQAILSGHENQSFELKQLIQEQEKKQNLLEAECAELRHTVAGLEGKCNEIALQRDGLSQQIAESQTQFAVQSEAIHAMTAEKRLVEEKLNTLEAECAELKNASADLERKTQEAAFERDAVRQQFEKLQKQAAAYADAENAAQQDKDQLTRQITGMKDQLGQMHAQELELRSTLSQNQSLRQMLNETEAALGQAHGRIRELESQLRALHEENTSADRKLQELKQSGEQMYSQESHLRQELEGLKLTYTKYRENAEREIAEQGHRIQRLLGQSQQLETTCQNDQAELHRLKCSLEETNEQKKYMEQEIELGKDRETSLSVNLLELENKVKTQESFYYQSIEGLRAERSGLEKEYQQLKCELESRRQEIERILQREGTLQQNLTELENTVKEQESQHQQSLSILQSEKDALQAEHHSVKLELENIRLQLEHLQKELRLRDEMEPSRTVPTAPADRRLEVILEPEELSALMALAEEEQLAFDSELPENLVQQQPAVPVSFKEEIPTFNLGDLILSEHRRSTSVRRKRNEETSPSASPKGIRQVVEQYVRPAAASQNIRAGSSRMWENDFLTPFQRELLQEVIQRDIDRLGERSIRESQRSNWL